MINQRYRLEFVTHLKKKHNIDLEKEWSKFIGNSTYLEMRSICRDVEKIFNLKKGYISQIKDRKPQNIAYIEAVMYIAYKRELQPISEITRIVNRDRSSFYHTIKRIEKHLSVKDKMTVKNINAIKHLWEKNNKFVDTSSHIM